jgi:hypothetical protein
LQNIAVNQFGTSSLVRPSQKSAFIVETFENLIDRENEKIDGSEYKLEKVKRKISREE